MMETRSNPPPQQAQDILRQLTTLYQASQAINQAAAEEEVVQAVVKQLSYGEFDRGMVVLFRDQKEPRGEVCGYWDRSPEAQSQPPAPWMSTTRFSPTTHFLNDIPNNPEAKLTRDHFGKLGVYSMATVPMQAHHDLIGALVLEARREFHFTVESLQPYEALATQAAVALENQRLLAAERQRTEELNSLVAISHAFGAITDLRQTYRELTQRMAEALGAQRCLIALYNPDTKEIVGQPPGYGVADDVASEFRYAVGDDLRDQWHLRRQGPFLTNNPQQDILDGLQRFVDRFAIRSLIVVPMQAKGQVIGMIFVINKPGGFSQRDAQLSTVFAGQAAIVIRNAQLYREQQQRALQIQTAAEVSRTAAAELAPQTLLQSAVDLIRDRFDYYHVSIFLLDPAGEWAVIRAATGHVGQKMVEIPYKLQVGSKSIIGTVTASGKAHIALDVGEDSVYFDTPLLPDTRSEMALPLIARGQVMGVLDVQSSQPAAFAESDVAILQSMADQVAIALHNARLFEELETTAAASEKQANQFAALLQVYQKVQTIPDLKTQIQTIAEGVVEANLFRRATLSVLDDAWQTIRAYSGYAGLTEDEIAILQGASPPTRQDRLLRFQEEFRIGNSYFLPAGQDPVRGRATIPSHRPAEQFEDWDPSDMLIAPLWMGEKLIGLLTVDDPCDRRRPTEESLVPLELFANMAARVIENSRLFADMEKLYQATSLLTSAQTVPEINQVIVDQFRELVNAEWASMFLVDHLTKRVVDMVESGRRFDENWLLTYDEIWEGMGGEVMRTNQPILSLDADDPREPERYQRGRKEQGMGSIMILPLGVGEQVMGAITLINRADQRRFTQQDLELATAVTGQASIALTNLRLLDEAQHRAVQLQTAAEVSRAASSVLDPGTLFSETIELIRQRFDYYYVGLFLVDEVKRWAVLQAGTGEAGRRQVEAGHRLRVGGESMIGQAVAHAQAQIALDVGAEAVHFVNPYLPDTRSEMALPLIVRDEVIGALTVQSVGEAAFTEQDIVILQTMADQLANAISNTRLLEQLQTSLAQVRKLHGRHVQDEWGLQAAARSAEARSGYEYDLMQVKATGPVADVEPGKDGTPGALIQPLALRGEVIGTLGIEAESPDYQWTEDEIAIMNAVATQVAQAMETAHHSEESERRAEQLTAAAEVGRVIASLLTAEELVTQAVDLIGQLFGFDHVAIFALNETGDYALLQEATGHAGAIMKESNYSLPVNGRPLRDDEQVHVDPVIWAIREQRPHIAMDIDQERWRQNPLLPDTRSEMAVPLVAGGQLLGALDVHSTQAAAFDQVDAAVLQTVADQIAVALDNARLFEKTRQSAAEQQMLFDVTTAAVTTVALDDMLLQVAQTIHESMGGKDVAIMMVDEEQSILRMRATAGFSSLEYDSIQIAVGEGLTGWVALTGEPVIVEDVSQSPRYVVGDPKTQSELVVPIMVDQAVVGVLNIESNELNAFDENDLLLLQTLSGTLGAILKSINLLTELQTANEQLQEMDRLKTTFLANMSHELRTPLNSIIGFSRVILKGIDGPITDLQEQDLTSIYNSGQHLLALINNVLELSKIEAGKMELAPEETEIAEIVSSVMSTAIGLVKGKEVELYENVLPDLPPVWADPFRLRQVLLNLMSNAANYTEQGSITIQAAYDSQAVFVQVVDTGIGIDEKDMDKLFKSFSQVDASSTRKVGGSGLGLAISAQFMEMQGGRIWVESKLGEGSTFSVAIPRVNPAGDGPITIITGEPAKEEPLVPAGPARAKLVLAIDDEPGVISLYQRYLSDRGYRVRGATDGQEGIRQAIALADELTAVTVDIIMPDIDGWEIIRQLREHPATRNLPIIVCSIKLDPGQAKALGVNRYLVKPILQEDLLSALEECCPTD